MWSPVNAYSTQPVVSPSSGMRRSSHSPLRWFLCYDSKSLRWWEGKVIHKASNRWTIRHRYNTHQSTIPKSVSKSLGRSSALLLFTYQGSKVLHKCKDSWRPCQRVYKPECEEQKKHLLKRKTHLNSPRFAQIAMPGFDLILLWEDLFFPGGIQAGWMHQYRF